MQNQDFRHILGQNQLQPDLGMHYGLFQNNKNNSKDGSVAFTKQPKGVLALKYYQHAGLQSVPHLDEQHILGGNVLPLTLSAELLR